MTETNLTMSARNNATLIARLTGYAQVLPAKLMMEGEDYNDAFVKANKMEDIGLYLTFRFGMPKDEYLSIARQAVKEADAKPMSEVREFCVNNWYVTDKYRNFLTNTDTGIYVGIARKYSNPWRSYDASITMEALYTEPRNDGFHVLDELEGCERIPLPKIKDPDPSKRYVLAEPIPIQRNSEGFPLDIVIHYKCGTDTKGNYIYLSNAIFGLTKQMDYDQQADYCHPGVLISLQASTDINYVELWSSECPVCHGPHNRYHQCLTCSAFFCDCCGPKCDHRRFRDFERRVVLPTVQEQKTQDLETKRLREAEAEKKESEDRRNRIQTERRNVGFCVMCGKPLGFFLKKLGREKHKECTVFSD